MKKRLLLIPLLTTGLLSGCWLTDLFGGKNDNYTIVPTIQGGTKEEKNAILEAINYKGICYPSGNPSASIYPDSDFTLKEDNGDNIYLVTKQKIKDKEVVINWKVDEKQEYFAERTKVDDRHDMVEIDYKGYGVGKGTFKYSIAKISCGGASSTNDKKLVYSVKTQNFSYLHEDKTIEFINTCTDRTGDPLVVSLGENKAVYHFYNTLGIMDYAQGSGQYSPYFKGNNPGTEKDYLYLNVEGKIIYTTPDGNWGLLADGNQVLELYAGAGTKILKSNFPHISDEYVKVSGNVGQYHGNVQLTFLSKFLKGNKSHITEPVVTFPALNEADIAALHNTDEGLSSDKQFIDGFSNSLHSVTGTIDKTSVKKENGDSASIDEMVEGNRYTFELVVGSERMTIAYDYHTGLLSDLKAKLKNSTTLTVKGTTRYAGSNSFPFVSLKYAPISFSDEDEYNEAVAGGAALFTRGAENVFIPAVSYDAEAKYYQRTDENDGAVWNIVPFSADHIVKVS